MRGPHRHPQSLYLILMDFVSSYLGHSLHQTHHTDASLNGMICGNEANITATHDKQLLRRANKIPVYQSLKGTCTIHPRQIATRKGQSLLSCTRGDQKLFGVYQKISSIIYYPNFFIFITCHRGGVEHHPDVGILFQLQGELCGDVYSSDSGKAICHGAKEGVGLKNQLSP